MELCCAGEYVVCEERRLLSIGLAADAAAPALVNSTIGAIQPVTTGLNIRTLKTTPDVLATAKSSLARAGSWPFRPPRPPISYPPYACATN
jgi:hypothetical protein